VFHDLTVVAINSRPFGPALHFQIELAMAEDQGLTAKDSKRLRKIGKS
jgi:hypothetical protein